MGSLQSWDYEGVFEIDDPQVDAYIDKLELAYTFDFSSKAYLKIAISHVIALSGFGGGNVQFAMDF